MIGQTISHYKITAKLGEGGMGVVYQAEDTKLQRPVALKFLRSDVLEDQEHKARFLREARAAASLNHPNISTIYEIDEADGSPFIAMELVEGESVKEKIKARLLKLDEAVDIAIQTAQGLQAAHEKAIVHRDIKSANLMVTPRGQVKILDFGLAQLAERSQLTKTAMILGTPAYMSPEQAQKRTTDRRTDIWSLAVVLYEMVAGKLPFEGERLEGVLYAIGHQEPEPLTAQRVDVPVDLDRLVGKAMAKSPDERYQHIEEMLVDLKALRPGASGAGTGSAAKTATAMLPSTPRSGRRGLYGGLAAAAAIVVLGAAYWLGSSGSRPQPAPGPSAPTKPYLTSYPGAEMQPSFSPDASQVTFVWGGGPSLVRDIYVKLIGVDPPRRITANPLDEFNPVWSPDGRWIAFLRKLDESNAEVLLVDPFGNRERKLTEVSAVASFQTRHLAWSPDSKQLVFVDKAPPAEKGSLFVVSIDSGEKRQLIEPSPGTYLDASPSFSPDGQRLVFTRLPAWGPAGDLHMLDASRDRSSQADLQRLTFTHWADAAGWTSDGVSVIYTASPGGRLSLYRVAVSGLEEPEVIAPLNSSEFFPAPALSRDGKRLVYAEQFYDTAITRLELPAGSGQPVSTKLIDATRRDMYGEYSPAGDRIAFNSNRSGMDACWASESDGSNAVQLTSRPGCRAPRWSPDGRSIMYSAFGEGSEDIWVVDSEGGGARPVISDPSEDLQASWSRDGEWIYFTSNRSGQYAVWKVPTDGGDPVQVTTTWGAKPIESIDGEWLYYIKDQMPEWETSLWRMPIQGGRDEKVLESVMVSFVVVEEGIYFISQTHPTLGPHPSSLDTYLQFYRFETREKAVIAEIQMAWKAQGLSVSPDGRSFLFSDSVREGSDLVMLEDFQ